MIAAVILARPICIPNTLIVRNMAATFIAGPEKRNVIAGPRPAPIFLIPANKGSIVLFNNLDSVYWIRKGGVREVWPYFFLDKYINTIPIPLTKMDHE